MFLSHNAGCELVIAWAEREVSANATEAEVEQFLDTACKDIPSPVVAEVPADASAIFFLS